jgi:hypothetical protein
MKNTGICLDLPAAGFTMASSIIEEFPMLRLTLAFAAIAVIAAPAGAATQCRNPKTKQFIKCPPAAAAAVSGGVTKDKNGKCHFASGPNKGKFTKCP